MGGCDPPLLAQYGCSDFPNLRSTWPHSRRSVQLRCRWTRGHWNTWAILLKAFAKLTGSDQHRRMNRGSTGEIGNLAPAKVRARPRPRLPDSPSRPAASGDGDGFRNARSARGCIRRSRPLPQQPASRSTTAAAGCGIAVKRWPAKDPSTSDGSGHGAGFEKDPRAASDPVGSRIPRTTYMRLPPSAPSPAGLHAEGWRVFLHRGKQLGSQKRILSPRLAIGNTIAPLVRRANGLLRSSPCEMSGRPQQPG